MQLEEIYLETKMLAWKKQDTAISAAMMAAAEKQLKKMGFVSYALPQQLSKRKAKRLAKQGQNIRPRMETSTLGSSREYICFSEIAKRSDYKVDGTIGVHCG